MITTTDSVNRQSSRKVVEYSQIMSPNDHQAVLEPRIIPNDLKNSTDKTHSHNEDNQNCHRHHQKFTMNELSPKVIQQLQTGISPNTPNQHGNPSPSTNNINYISSSCPSMGNRLYNVGSHNSNGNGSTIQILGSEPIIGAETYYGYIGTVQDAVLIVEACRYGRLGRIKKRLSDKDRSMIRSGSVFVFIEKESKIKRWTDGKIWSPSRICGEFLLYRELEQKPLPFKRGLFTSNNSNSNNSGSAGNNINMGTGTRRGGTPSVKISSTLNKSLTDSTETASRVDGSLAKEFSDETINSISNDSSNESKLMIPGLEDLEDIEKEVMKSIISSSNSKISAMCSSSLSLGALEGGSGGSSSSPFSSSSKSLIFKQDGLVKKTISLNISEETYHLICYFKESQVNRELLALSPNRLSAFENLKICSNLSPFIIHENPQISNVNANLGSIPYQLLKPIGGDLQEGQQQQQQLCHHQNQHQHQQDLQFISGNPHHKRRRKQHKLVPATPVSTPLEHSPTNIISISANVIKSPSTRRIKQQIEEDNTSEEQLLFTHFIEAMRPSSSVKME